MDTAENYIKFYNKYCKKIDTRTFRIALKLSKDFVCDEKCPSQIRIVLMKWLFTRIFMLHELTKPDLDRIYPSVIKTIKEERNIIGKGEYIQYHERRIADKAVQYFYNNRFEDEYFVLQLINDTNLFKIILSVADKKEIIDNFFKWYELIDDYNQRSNLLDVLVLYFSDDPRTQKVVKEMSGETDNIYKNHQNVHDADVVRATTQAAANMIEDWYKPLNFNADESYSTYLNVIFEDLIGYIPTERKCRCSGIVHECNCSGSHENLESGESGSVNSYTRGVIERICIDNTIFGDTKGDTKGNGSFTIMNIVIAYYNYVKDHKYRDTICEILKDEIKPMAELCASGYVARLIGTVQGMCDPKYEVHISDKKHVLSRVNAVISESLSSLSESNRDLIIEGTYNPEYLEKYLKFITSAINNSTIEQTRTLIKVLNKLVNSDEINYCFKIDNEAVFFEKII